MKQASHLVLPIFLEIKLLGYLRQYVLSNPEVYVHLSGGDIERKMLENVGLIDVDGKGPTTLEPVMCPRCRSLNVFDAIYCSKCSMALNEQAAMKVENSADEAKESEEYRAILELLRKDLGMLSS